MTGNVCLLGVVRPVGTGVVPIMVGIIIGDVGLDDPGLGSPDVMTNGVVLFSEIEDEFRVILCYCF